MKGIATSVTAWLGGRIRRVNAPRALVTELKRGTVYGAPGDHDQQRRVLQASLDLLEQEAPLDLVYIDESLGDEEG